MSAEQVVSETGAQVAERVADKVIAKTGDFVEAAASAATNVFEAASNILTTAVDKYGQQVVDAVLWVVRIDAIQSLVTWWIIFSCSVGFIYWVVTGFTKRKWWEQLDDVADQGGGMMGGFLVIGCIISGVMTFVSASHITDVWTYTAVAKPELYLAKQAVDIVKTKLETASKK